MKNELYKLSAVDLLSMYKTGETNPLEVSLDIIKQLENKNSQFNAFVCFDKEKILQQAKLSSERWSSGKVKGILDGIPISIKDLLVTKDYPTRRGSFIESLPITSDKDAPVVKKILEQGGIVLGKTTTPEFGHKGTTQSKRYGATLNPWSTELNSGGSSGGSASAVAAGIGPLSIGTDGGGSVRIPCSFCGLFGHKPTFGKVPAYPISPFGTVANIGPITRTVADGGLLMNVIAKPDKDDWLDGKWSGLGQYTKEAVIEDGQYQRGKTSISIQKFNEIGKALTKIPNEINAHKTVKRMLDNKQKQLTSGKNIDWATAEALAFGSLLVEGYPVRLSGQDCTRGTFSHRHSAVIDQLTEERYYPLNNISKNQKHYEVIDSMLSEYAVLGYEYGYSLAEPNSLTIWEAQFGDFSNGAQIMIDQFISSGEKKWLRMSGLVMLLPHGYEGQGPEHSSARLERFLQACAEDNWIIANCTTPSNYFHILRRQLYRSFRKPLVIMSPKSLLRNKRAVSSKEDFVNGSTFHRVLWDDAEKGNSITKLHKDSKIKRVIICSGKIYFDLLNEREQREISDIYLLRLEQFYPFPALSFIKELSRFKDAEFVWCQEEPKNQGGWSFVEPNLEWSLNRVKAKYKRARYIGRAAAASPATGLATQHKKQQEMIINEALTID